ncbi:MAG TPA: carboxypeptidase regulatory-like domain-containing protein [Thermoanaerobaculia bacterium]
MPTGAYRIEAALNSRDKGAATGIAAAGDVLVKDIAIVIGAEGSGTIRGLVKFPDGAIAAGVVVSIDDRGVLSNFDGTFELSPVVVKPFEQQRIVARSLDGLRAGLTSVLVSQPNQIISNVVIVLSGIGSVEFTVLDASRNPVPDQDVALFGECANPCGCASKKTDVNGKVRFEGVPLGTAIARATRTAFDSLDQATGTATLLSDGATAFGVMQFTGFGSVTGTVLNPDNSPALGADVKLMAKVFNEDICSLVEGIAQRVRTDAAGKFRFTGVNVGNVSVSVSHPFFTTNVGARGTLSKNGDTVDFALKLVNTISGVLSGTVYLPDGRTPAGAGVEVTAFGPLPDVTVMTDANGHFQFAKIFPEGTYNVTARDAATGGVRREQLYLRAAQDVTHDFRLKGRGTVNVKVVNGAGQPVTTSAFVRLEESEYPNRTYEAALEAANNGIATFTNVFEGPLTATASDAFARGGRASSVLASPGATLDMTVAMTTTGTVKGHFYKTDGVTPIPFGGVRLVINGTTVGQATTNGTDDVGAFTFTYVPAGPVRLEAQDPQTARSGVAAGSVTSEGEVVTLDIRAQGLGTVQGLVTSNGAAQPGAQVMIDAGQIHASTITDSTGRYSIDGLPEGRVVATASLSGNFLTGTNSGVLSGEASTLTLDVALRDSGKISGKVVNADGVTAAPLSYVTALASGATLSTTSDTQGNFTFDRVPTGSVSLSASVLGGIDKGSATTDVAANATANATITLNGVGSITGRALDSGGLPIAGDITITGSGAFPYSFTVQSQSDGNFALPQVLAGPFTASLRAKSGEFFLYGTTSSNVGAGQTANVTVQVQPSGTVTALVVRSNGTTSAVGANVTLQLDPNRGTVSLQTGTDGRFTARGVPLGAFTVRVNDPITTGLALKSGRIDNNGDTADLGTMVLDDKPLTVVSVTPTDGTTGVPINTSVVLTFSNVLQSAFGISIYDGATPLSATATFSSDGKTVTLNGTWPDSKELTVSVSTSVTDIFGRHPLTSSSTKFRTVDLTPPRVSTIVPANGAFQVDPSSAITITFNEPITGTADVVVSSTTGTTTATSPTTIVFTPSAPLAINTIYTVNVNGAIDTSGNHQTVAFTSSFSTTDTIAPSVTIASPTAAWIRNTRPQIQINSTDATSGVNAAAATLRLDGNIVAPSVSGTTLFFTPSTDLADGNHTIAASVPDRAGNAGIANGSFGVDITAPGAATITSVTEGQLLKGNVTLTASATDATSGVAKIEVFADDVLIATLNAPSFSGVFNSAALPDGAHVLSARATDVAGNAGAVGTAVHVTTDNTPLTVAFTSPQPNQPLRDTVIATAVPNRAVTRIDFTLATQTNSVTSAPYTTTFSLSALAQGQQTITAAAFGTDGQTASATVTFIVDRTAPPAPDVTRITAEPGANATATVLGQSGAIEGNARIEIRNLNNGFLGTFAAAADGSFVAAIQGVQDDTLSLVAIDVAGNRSSSSTISVKQNPSLPVISWTCSSPGAMVPTGYAAKLRVFALGNNQGNTANVVQKVEFYIAGSPTPVLGTAVSGVANNYETTYTVTGADGTSIPVLAVVTNTAGTTAEVSTSITIVSGVSITTNTTIDAANTTYENQTLIIRSGTTTITGEHSFARLIVLDGATVTHPRTDLPADRLSIGSATPGDIYVSCNGAIDVTGKGYADVLNGFGHTDPSASSGSRTPSGGSHGGEGGGGQPGATYGSPFDPNELGAAGSWGSNCGNCVAGGGIARLKGKTVVVDGRIWSHAKLVDQGGQASGAGGSIRIDAELLSGGGEIRAEGIGRGDFEGSGGGGRIAVYYRNLSFDRSKITAAGGANTNAASVGAAGTVYFRQVDAAGLKISDQLVIDNRGRVAPNRAGIPMIGVGSVVSVSGATVTVGGSIPDGVQGFFIEFLSSAAAVVSRYEIASRTSATTIVLKLAPGETQANVPIPGTYRGVLSVDQFTLRASGSLTMSGVIAAKNVSMTSTTLRHPLSTGSTVHRLEFDVDTLTIDSTSAIDASGGGYANITGTGETYPGVSGSFGKAGGSHGGRGGPYVGTPGATYGSITNPNEAGAAGSGGNCFACATGGGIVRIKANSLVLNGKIWSNAGGVTLGGFSSGAAGSIRLDVASLSGTGEIHAEGNGRGDFEGSGGGGRIAVYYQSMSFDKTKIIAQGGANTTPSSVGGPGSVYFQQVDATGAKISEQTLYDNRGRVTQATLPFAPAITGTISAVSGATVTVSSTLPEGIEKMLVEFFNASGALVSTYRIAARTSATTMVVELVPGESQANAPVPGTFRVVWRFDNLVINGAGTIEMTGILRAGSLAVSNSTFFTQPVFAGTINRLTIQVDNDFTLDSTSGIDVTGRGFNDSLNGGGRTWNGYAGGNRSGGSHGGQGGGSSPGPTYGSAYDPDTPGAAGSGDNCGNCGAGGGIARVQAKNFVLDGKILSNAGVPNAGQGSGAGGSIRIDAETFGGLGEIHADGTGRSTFEGAGGGGRIAVYYTTMTFDRAKIFAIGGPHNNAANVGAPGTIFLKSSTQSYGELLIDNRTAIAANKTTLPGVGPRTVSSYTIDTLRDAAAHFQFPNHLRGLRVFLGTSTAQNWPIIANDETSVQLDVTNAILVPQTGQAFRGLHKLDALKLRNAKVETTDYVEVSTPVDKDGTSTLTTGGPPPP